MKKEILKIIPSPLPKSKNNYSVYLSAFMAQHLNINENSTYTLICGINKLPVKVEKISEMNIRNDILWLTEDIFHKFLIPEGITLEVIFTDEIIRIGPIIAVLTENKYLKEYLSEIERVEEYLLYADAADQIKSLIYIFSSKGLNIKDKYIDGYLPVKEKNNQWVWRKKRLPMPDLICNRMAAAASSPAFKKIKLIEEIVPDIKIINRITKISKWKIAEILQKDQNTSKYIPETHLFEEPEDIVKMLEKHPEIYLKPVRRSLGLGIIKMEKNTDENYTAYYCANGTNHKLIGSVNQILESLGELMGKRVYIVQQGIPVALYKEKIFDIRVTVQKNDKGQWSFVRWVARVAAPGNIVSNVAAGGIGLPAEKVINENFGDRINKIKDEVRKAGILIGEALDKRLKDIGDLGLDIGIDRDGKVYLFEVNFRAIRPSNINSRDAKAWFQMYHIPIYYLKYLYDVKMDKEYNPQP